MNPRDFPVPCFLKFPENLHIKSPEVLIVGFVGDRVITISPFPPHHSRSDPFLIATLEEHAAQGLKWSADRKDWHDFAFQSDLNTKPSTRNKIMPLTDPDNITNQKTGQPFQSTPRLDPHGGIDEVEAREEDTSDPRRLAPRVINSLGIQTELARAVVIPLLQNLQTLDKKQQDYGSLNLTKFGTYGVVVRMNDKMERIINLDRKRRGSDGMAVVNNEPIADSLLDLANYALIAYVMEKAVWPFSEKRN